MTLDELDKIKNTCDCGHSKALHTKKVYNTAWKMTQYHCHAPWSGHGTCFCTGFRLDSCVEKLLEYIEELLESKNTTNAD